MRRTFTVELSEDEAATLWRISEWSGVPVGQIVRHLHSTNLLRLAVCLNLSEWETTDEETGRLIPMTPGQKQEKFRACAGLILGACFD